MQNQFERYDEVWIWWSLGIGAVDQSNQAGLDRSDLNCIIGAGMIVIQEVRWNEEKSRDRNFWKC